MNVQLHFLICLSLFPDIHSNRRNNRFETLQKLRAKAEQAYHSRRYVAFTQCSDQPQSRTASNLLKDFGPESLSSESGRQRRATVRSKDTAVFLDNSEGQWSSEHDVPDHEFTVAVWCRPEGGQISPAVILESEDLCLPFPDRGWSLGLHTPDGSGERDLRFYFRLHAWSKLKPTTLTSPLHVPAGEWVHVAVTFDGTTMVLYLNSAQVSISNAQSTSPYIGSTCPILRLGGHGNHYFRGRVDDLKVWDQALYPIDIKAAQFRHPSKFHPKVLDDFIKLDSWDWSFNQKDSGIKSPILLLSDVPASQMQALQPNINSCGFTICDSPEVSVSYKNHWTFRKRKVLRYRVVVLSEDDGSNRTVSPQQIRQQHDYLLRAYERYNITWELDEVLVKNSNLRSRSILLSCYATMVGNGHCDPECRHPSTGNDGGDCDDGAMSSYQQNYIRVDEDEDSDDIACAEEDVSNGICDPSCNVAFHEWDGGDCCLVTNPSCYDPRSPNRSYLDARELKSLLKLKNTRHINVLFAHWTNRDILGVATFPWEKNVFTELGGIVLQSSSYGSPGQMSTLIHELGHSLGLWHVHRGVSEMDCSHPCFENEPTQYHGDLCGDTQPTPMNLHCQDPTASVCGRSKFVDTPYTNYMGYADDTCVTGFSPEQVSRMHCHIDLVYNSVRVKINEQPSPPVLLAPISATNSSVALSWIPSLSMDAFYDSDVCSYCSNILEFSQYGYAAESSETTVGFGDMCTATEATGPPDSETCTLSYKMWLPDAGSCPNDLCTLTISFEHPAVASVLQIWVTWNAHKGLREVELVFQDGSTEVLYHLTAQCNSPLTLPLFYKKILTKVHIRTSHIFVGIDAVKMTSVPNNPICSPCKPIRYRISRDPAFASGLDKEVDYPVFIDNDLQPRTSYTYRIQSWLGSRITDSSPPLIYTLGSPVCGDGIIAMNELCDDGNIASNDGCSSTCVIEHSFHCVGEPSFCYWHDFDGRCEDFELSTNPSDCGFYTPKGFTDQWAKSVETGSNKECPADVVAGSPSLPFSCKSDQISDTSWSPCEIEQDAWLTARFQKAVVTTSIFLYFTSDGFSNSPFQEPVSSTLTLLDEDGIPHHEVTININCIRAPLEVSINKDLGLAFSKTAAVNLTFPYVQVAISAIRLRSSNLLNPVEIGKCSAGEQYHPGLQKCDKYCNFAHCPYLHAKHAQLNCTGMTDGDTCTLICDPGYQNPKKSAPILCQAGEWVGPDPHCKPVDCGTPLLAHADLICPDGTSFGKFCSYKCRPPARFLGGGSGLATVVCESNGKWSKPNLVCQLNCHAPSPPANMVLANSRCRKSDNFPFGHACRFRCKVGYHVEGQSTRKRILHLRCDLSGSWSGPNCVPVTCDAIQGVPHNCTSGNVAGSDCRIMCPNQGASSSRSHRCEIDGNWNPPILGCSSAISCIAPPKGAPNVQFLCEGNYVGALCKTSCANEDEQSSKPGVMTEKIRIRCDARGRWTPDPSDIQCIKKCMPKYIGDGYCDSSNNAAHCDYDGGDCCASTALWNIVKPFPQDCGEACSCLDPQTTENSK